MEEQKKGFEELGQKMYDCQQRGIKGAPKKVQVECPPGVAAVLDVVIAPTRDARILRQAR